jgi:Protein of unknown function (DUF2793)
MPDNMTARHALPNLYVGQTQKEVAHNEALARIDALLHPVVESKVTAPVEGLSAASDGLCWLITAPSTGIWAGRARQIARWSGGSWRYFLPVGGMTIWLKSSGKRLFYIDSDWFEPSAISDPSGGSIIDAEARSAIVAILSHLRQVSGVPD